MTAPRTAARRAWARGFGVTLAPARPSEVATPAIQRALRDGIERNFEGDLPAPPDSLEWYSILTGGQVVGVLVFRRGEPAAGAVTFRAVAIAPEHRGRAFGARSLLAAERRLRPEAPGGYFSRVPRTNGRGLYFMLRCGYAPVAPPLTDGATWFRRYLTPGAADAVRRARRRQPSSAHGPTAGS